MDQSLINIEYLWGVVLRRWHIVLIPGILGTILAVMVAFTLPSMYRAQAIILVEGPQIPVNLAQSTVNVGPGQTVALIRQRLTTRENLLEIAERFNIFAGRTDMSPSDIVTEMRQTTRIGVARGGNNVRVAFEAANPAIAAQVTNEFLSRLLAENARVRSSRATGTLNFFENEVTRLQSQIEGMERRIAQFRVENEDSLPNSLEFRRNRVVQLESAIQQRENRRAQLLERQALLRERIETGEFGETRSEGGRRELRRLQTSLLQQRAVFTESHPTIRRLEAQIAALETSIENGFFARPADDEEEDGVPAAMRRAEQEIENIDSELVRLDELDVRSAREIEALEETIARTPSVQIALRSLEREYQTLQVQHRQAIQRQAEAATGERIEVNQQAERFEVIEQPRPPERPFSPNRVMIAGAGSVLSFGLGFGIVVLLELLHWPIRTVADLERSLSIRPIVALPYISTKREIALRRWKLRILAFILLVTIPLALLLLHVFYLPIPVLIERAVEATGLDTAIALLEARFGR